MIDIAHEDRKEKVGCFACCIKLDLGAGRYNTPRGQVCITCYVKGRYLSEMMEDSALLKKTNYLDRCIQP